MKRYFIGNRFGVLAAAALLAACASTGPAPVEDRSLDAPRREAAAPRNERPPAPAQAGGTYRVQRGDTLYSIAFRHGLDYRELASWNGIAAPYTIYVGRELRLSARQDPGRAVAAAPPPAAQRPTVAAPPAAAKPSTPPSSAPGMPKPAPFENVTERAAQTVAANPPSTAAPPTAPAPQTEPATAAAGPAPKPPGAAPPPSVPPPAPTDASATVGDIVWRWPADGQIISGFVGGDQTKQGIDVAGKAGDPVRAAADGAVVYSGNGLIGYGELIIVKHSPGFLSAYGHNRKRLVKEGDRVKSGQVIAEMGSSSANRDSLHFEIRKNGKPANPLDYLPRR